MDTCFYKHAAVDGGLHAVRALDFKKAPGGASGNGEGLYPFRMFCDWPGELDHGVLCEWRHFLADRLCNPRCPMARNHRDGLAENVPTRLEVSQGIDDTQLRADTFRNHSAGMEIRHRHGLRPGTDGCLSLGRLAWLHPEPHSRGMVDTEITSEVVRSDNALTNPRG